MPIKLTETWILGLFWSHYEQLNKLLAVPKNLNVHMHVHVHTYSEV
jgi:hypothetical protein